MRLMAIRNKSKRTISTSGGFGQIVRLKAIRNGPKQIMSISGEFGQIVRLIAIHNGLKQTISAGGGLELLKKKIFCIFRIWAS